MSTWLLHGFLHLPQVRRKGYRFRFLVFFIAPFILFVSASFAKTTTTNYRAAVVIDASTQEVLYAKNSDHKLPPASTTKLMTAIIALENKSLSDIVTISKTAARVRPTKAGLREGDKITVEGLLYAALLKSGNDAAVALAEAVAGSEEKFVRLMNQKAMAVGATNTTFINASGLPGPGQYITASDLSKIMICALKYPKLKEIIGTAVIEVSTEEGKTLSLKNTDKLLWLNEEVIGGKTGYTANAGHCLVCAAEHDTKTIIVAILGSPSRKALWKETESLLRTVLKK